MELPKSIKDEIWEYCRLNDIPNIDDFNIKMLKQGFTIEKYGTTPIEPKVEIKEVVKEVVKEVEVIKEVFISDDKEITKIMAKMLELENKKKEEIGKWEQKVSALNEEIKNLKDALSKANKKDIYGES